MRQADNRRRDAEGAGTRDVVVVGASAGGVAAVRRLVAELPPDFGAALFVTIHRGLQGPPVLAQVLDSAGPLPAAAARDGEPFAPGRIYVAPPDRHLLVGRDHVHVRRGPRENRSRPAIDPMFRTAAVHCSSRVVGVLLTGMLDDGTAGLLAIRRCGGLAVVQEPSDALFDSMPRSAIAHGAADEVVTLARLPELLARLVRQPRPPPVEPPDALRYEAMIAAQELRMDPDHNVLGTLAPLTCPDCHGAMHEIRENGLIRYRCHTGHAFTAEALRAAQTEEIEKALYNALRSQEEQLALMRRMAEEAALHRGGGGAAAAADYERRARSYAEGVEIIRRLLANGRRAPADTVDG